MGMTLVDTTQQHNRLVFAYLQVADNNRWSILFDQD